MGEGWDYSNQRKSANTFGEVDRIVIAAGFLQTPEVIEPLLQKLDQLTIDSCPLQSDMPGAANEQGRIHGKTDR